MDIKESIKFILNNYINEKRKDFADNKFIDKVEKDISEVLKKELDLDLQKYNVVASCGKGRWTDLPWISIFPNSVTDSAKRGYYFVVLFKTDMTGYYLSLNQGADWYKERKLSEYKESIVNSVRKDIQKNKLIKELGLSTEIDLIDRKKTYEPTNIFSKYYEKGSTVSNEELKNIIKQMLKVLDNITDVVGNEKWQEYNYKIINQNSIAERNNRLNEFKIFYFENKDKIKKEQYIIDRQKLLEDFKKENSLELLENMDLEQYIIGKGDRSTFCYNMEYGKFKGLVPGNRSGSSGYSDEDGIYYSKEEKDKNGNIQKEGYMYDGRIVENPKEIDKIWEKVRKDLTEVLYSIQDARTISDIKTGDSLKRMSSFITKIAFCFFPEKVMWISSAPKIGEILNYFEYKDNYYNTYQLAYLLNYYIRNDIPELKNEDPIILGQLMWNFYEEKIRKGETVTVEKGINLIIYGVPGSGKSYSIKKELIEKGKYNQQYMERVTFYPEYTYYDFVGQMVPDKESNGIVFQEGNFTRILKKALADKNNQYYLIIEEMNRGNAEAIFGDIFQLLDRDEKGISEYSINNENLKNKINEYLTEKNMSNIEEIRIPSNLTIYATINNADQNVFNFDSAFGRRWEYKVMPCNSANSDKDIYFKYIKGTDQKWDDIRKKINNEIINNKDIYNAEEKRMGLFFIDKEYLCKKKNYNGEDLEEIAEKFANKIFRYLYLNVFRNNPNSIFIGEKTLEEYIIEFKENRNIFDILNLGENK